VTVLKETIVFPNANGEQLAAVLDRPDSEPVAYGIFAHCFTCSKNIGTVTRVSRALAERGLAILRFDFTGIGGSEGDFSETNFSSNLQDLVAASDYLQQAYEAPKLAIGHSLGGAAVIAAAAKLTSVKAIATIAAPSDPAHMHHLLRSSLAEIQSKGWARVEIGGQGYTIRKQFLDDVAEHNLDQALAGMDQALLIMHSLQDEMIEIEHAYHLFEVAQCPKSFITLKQADHLIGKLDDVEFVADMIAAWAIQNID
jgi:putative redox protein